jgi:acyl-coenzyme A synthetase/AMP-(fatty) acid ligase
MLARGEIRPGDASPVGRLVGRLAARQLGLQDAREIFSGTSPLDPATHAFCGAIGWYVRNTYGVSECGGAATISGRDRMVPGELGQPVDGIELVVDDDGEILLAGQTLMRGFIGQPAQEPGTRLATGDLGEWTADGSALLFRGRRSSVIETPAGPSTLDAVEHDAEQAFPGTTAVVVRHGADGDRLGLLLVRREGFDGAIATTHAVRQWVAAQVAADTHVAAIAAAVVDDRQLDVTAGEVGPTGKVRRWMVATTRGAAFMPSPASAVRPPTLEVLGG